MYKRIKKKDKQKFIEQREQRKLRKEQMQQMMQSDVFAEENLNNEESLDPV